MSQVDLRPLARDADGQRRPGRQKAPRSHRRGLLETEQARHFYAERYRFTYGSKWKQRYFKKQGDDYFVFPAQWDVRARAWRPYSPGPGTDWWLPYYPAEQTARPTGPLCDGCHSVNYDIKTHN